MDTETKPKKVRVCRHCMSADVTRDATAAWDEVRAEWSIADMLDNSDCTACGANGNGVITSVTLGGEATSPKHKALLARYALENWCINSGVTLDDPLQRIVDLLTGIEHLARRMGVDIEEAADMAVKQFMSDKGDTDADE